MIFIDSSELESRLPETWKSNAKMATEELEAESDESERKKIIEKYSGLWRDKDLKAILLDLSHNKCWYSEAKETVSDYDVDHFRPKGRVKNLNSDIVSDHGYWWLAFDSKNYRLSGIYINRARGSGGKCDFFPIQDEAARAFRMGNNVSYEKPLLLDPTNKEDCNLIICSRETGEMFPIFDEGDNQWLYSRAKASIDILNLNTPLLVDARKEKFNEFKRHRDLIVSNTPNQTEVSHILEMMKPEKEFSSSIRGFCIQDITYIQAITHGA